MYYGQLENSQCLDSIPGSADEGTLLMVRKIYIMYGLKSTWISPRDKCSLISFYVFLLSVFVV